MKLGVTGATGRVGRHVVSQAAQRGHQVTALTRREAAPLEGVTWITGSIDDLASLRRVVEGADAVISAIGPSPSRKSDTCLTSTRNLVAAGARRVIVVSGTGVTLPGDRKSVLDRFMAKIVSMLSPEIYRDKVLELEFLQSTDIDWTAVRVGALFEGKHPNPIKADAITPPGARMDTASLASFLLDEAEQPRFIRRAPFVAL